jgi:hypothetical protein
MDINDISNCLTLIEEALHSDIFKYEKTEVRTDRLITKLESRHKAKKTQENNSVQSFSKSDKSVSKSDSSDLQMSETSSHSDITDSSATNLSGNYSNIQPITIASDLFKMSESPDVDSNSYYNLAFSNYNNMDNTEVDAKIITYRKQT